MNNGSYCGNCKHYKSSLMKCTLQGWHCLKWDFCKKFEERKFGSDSREGDSMNEKNNKYETFIVTEHYSIHIEIETDSEELLSSITEQFGRITINEMD